MRNSCKASNDEVSQHRNAEVNVRQQCACVLVNQRDKDLTHASVVVPQLSFAMKRYVNDAGCMLAKRRKV